MSQPYSAEARRIFRDFLGMLARCEQIDAVLLTALGQMMDEGELDNRKRIKEVVVALEERGDELQDR